jgi:hypothetical protein
VVALAECGTHAFLAAEIGDYATGEKTLAARRYPPLRDGELLTADRNSYSWQAWDSAQATGAALLWRAPTQLDLPVVEVLPDGTYSTVLIRPTIRGGRRERLLAAARAGLDLDLDLDDIDTVPDAFDERGLPVVHLARVVEYDVPDRKGNGSGELIVLLTNVLAAARARATKAPAWSAAPPPGRRTFPPRDWHDALPKHLGDIAGLLIPDRRERECPRAVKRARHNNYRVKKPGEPARIRHDAPPTIRLHSLNPRAA